MTLIKYMTHDAYNTLKQACDYKHVAIARIIKATFKHVQYEITFQGYSIASKTYINI